MIKEEKKLIITGKVDRDIFGSYEDCSPGLYIGPDYLESCFNLYLGKTVKVTIEEINEEETP